jgi:hypothetical protein
MGDGEESCLWASSSTVKRRRRTPRPTLRNPRVRHPRREGRVALVGRHIVRIGGGPPPFLRQGKQEGGSRQLGEERRTARPTLRIQGWGTRKSFAGNSAESVGYLVECWISIDFGHWKAPTPATRAASLPSSGQASKKGRPKTRVPNTGTRGTLRVVVS